MGHESISEVPCEVAPGMFNDEVVVLIELPSGEVVTGLFDRSYVSFEGQLDKNAEIEGKFGVEIIEEDRDTVLIQFTGNPGLHLINGFPRARVPKDFLLPQVESVSK